MQFLKSYIVLDSLLKDMYQSKNGVTEYINDMMKIENGSAFVCDRDSNLEPLKRLRHIRNRLCHEAGSFGEDLCSESDIRWLDNFRERLINQTDPLSLYEKHMETIKKSIKIKSHAETVRQLPKASKFPAKALLFAALTVISFIAIFSLVLIYFLFYK
jgi:hypothetical protein